MFSSLMGCRAQLHDSYILTIFLLNRCRVQILEELGLTDVRDSLVGGGLSRGLSGGEKRRLSIATELLTRPALLFLDEPTTGLGKIRFSGDIASVFVAIFIIVFFTSPVPHHMQTPPSFRVKF